MTLNPKVVIFVLQFISENEIILLKKILNWARAHIKQRKEDHKGENLNKKYEDRGKKNQV